MKITVALLQSILMRISSRPRKSTLTYENYCCSCAIYIDENIIKARERAVELKEYINLGIYEDYCGSFAIYIDDNIIKAKN